MTLKNPANKILGRILTALSIAVFVFFYVPSLGKTLETIMIYNLGAVKDFRSFQSNLKTPHAGEHVLPPANQEILALLRNHQLDSYNISEKIMNDELIYQRLIESAWPRKMSPDSKYKFMFVSELDDSSTCREVGRRKEAALVFCR